MTTGKYWIGGNPGSWENSGSTTPQRQLSPYTELRKEIIAPQPQKTQLGHQAGLVLNIPEKPWPTAI